MPDRFWARQSLCDPPGVACFFVRDPKGALGALLRPPMEMLLEHLHSTPPCLVRIRVGMSFIGGHPGEMAPGADAFWIVLGDMLLLHRHQLLQERRWGLHLHLRWQRVVVQDEEPITTALAPASEPAVSGRRTGSGSMKISGRRRKMLTQSLAPIGSPVRGTPAGRVKRRAFVDDLLQIGRAHV